MPRRTLFWLRIRERVLSRRREVWGDWSSTDEASTLGWGGVLLVNLVGWAVSSVDDQVTRTPVATCRLACCRQWSPLLNNMRTVGLV
jgi:hypothetical protein